MANYHTYTTSGTFIDPTKDPGFKILFGRESSKDILMALLNAILEDDKRDPITDINFLDKEKISEQEEERSVSFDLQCETSCGRRFIVEMQNVPHEWFIERILYYTARAITEQGKPSDWDYSYKPVISIAFTNFTLKRFEGQVLLNSKPIELISGKPITDHLRLIIIQLPQFEEEDPEKCESELQKWIYTIKNLKNMERIPFANISPIFKRVESVARVENLSKDERRRYESDLKIYRDMYSGMKAGFKQGKAEGFASGRNEGLEEGRAEGRAEGEVSKTIEVALKMKQANSPVEFISQITGLSVEEINSL